MKKLENYLKARNDTAHIYDANAAKTLAADIISLYIPEFERMKDNILSRYPEITV